MARINVQETIDRSKMNKFFWRIYLVCIFVIVFDGYDMNIFGPIMPALLNDPSLQLTPVTGGLLASYALYGMLIGSFFFGFLADKIGQKKVIIIGVVIYGIFTGLTGSADGQVALAICRFVSGLGIAGVVPGALAYITEYTPKASRGGLTTWVNIGLTFGGILATALAIVFLQSMGWRFMFYIAYVPIVMAVIVQLAMPETMLTYHRKGNTAKMKAVLQQANPDYTPRDDDELELNQVKSAKVPFASLFKGKFARNTILICICYFINFYLLFGMSTWVPNLMIAQGYPLAGGLWFLMIFNLGTILGTTFGSWAAPKFGYKKMLMIYYIISAILLIILSIKVDAVPMGILLFVTGATVLGTSAMFNSFVTQSYPATFRSTALGTGLGIGRLGGAAGPIIGGVLLAAQVPLIVNFLAFAIPSAIGAIIIFGTRDFTKIDINSEEAINK